MIRCAPIAAALGEIAETLGPSVGDGSLQIRLRLRYNHRLESSRFAAEMLVASAIAGNLPGAMPQLIGLKQSDTEARLRQQWATNSFFRPETADRIRLLLRTQITNLLNEDMQWMENQGLLRLTTPVMVQRNGNGLRRGIFRKSPPR